MDIFIDKTRFNKKHDEIAENKLILKMEDFINNVENTHSYTLEYYNL
jgi:hypothetical protein